MDKKSFGAVSGIVALMIALAWWLGWFNREDALIAQTRAIVETPSTEQTPQQQADLRNAWRDRFQGLNDEQRRAMFESMMPIFMPLMMRQFENRYDEFMKMSPDEQRRKLDDRINEMQKRGGMGGPGGDRPAMDPKQMAEMQKKFLAYTTPEQRSKMDNGMRILADRMKERGLSPPQFPGGGFF